MKKSISEATGRWPEGAIVYHIYPRSFQDTNNDGIGDLRGIKGRLPYLQTLGVTAIWLSPFYPSPMADFGYDVADYCAVDPIFGSLDDFKELLKAADASCIKVIIDLVPNHTSDEHEWFKSSRKAKSGTRADWYVWRDAKGHDVGGTPLPPNNWRDALTGSSAWEWEKSRSQFYLHSFDAHQPDLNWTNVEVREAFKEIMRFWLNLGVDGFRVDAVYWMGKEPLMHDDPENPEYMEGRDLRYEALVHTNSRGWPQLYAYLSEMCEVLKENAYKNKERFMVTEAYPERHNLLASYLMFYVGMDPRVAAPFNFEGVSLPWEAAPWRHFLTSFHTALDQLSPYCVPSYAFGNHDHPRLVSRLGVERARSAAMMLLTLPGMAFIYYGEELGMHNVSIPPQYIRDPAARGGAHGHGGRDPERTPMQWSTGKHAGFSDADETWLPVSSDYTAVNVDKESEDAASFLSLYRQLGKLRNDSSALKKGTITVLEGDNEDVLVYLRSSQHDDAYLTFVNFSDNEEKCHAPTEHSAFVLSSSPNTVLHTYESGPLKLQPHEAAVFSICDTI